MKLNNDFTVNSEDLDDFQRIIDVTFENTANLIGPLVHGSLFSGDSARLNCFKTANNLAHDNYEKLEFLGDSVLGLIVSEYFYTDRNIEEYANIHKRTIESTLTDVRKALVSNKSLKPLADDLNLNEYILCSGLENIDDISENVIEALIGGIFCDKGYIEAKKFVHKFFDIDGALGKIGTSNPKGDVKEICDTNRWGLEYKLTSQSGADHKKLYGVELYIENEPVSTGSGLTIKKAEANAAERYLRHAALA